MMIGSDHRSRSQRASERQSGSDHPNKSEWANHRRSLSKQILPNMLSPLNWHNPERPHLALMALRTFRLTSLEFLGRARTTTQITAKLLRSMPRPPADLSTRTSGPELLRITRPVVQAIAGKRQMRSPMQIESTALIATGVH